TRCGSSSIPFNRKGTTPLSKPKTSVAAAAASATASTRPSRRGAPVTDRLLLAAAALCLVAPLGAQMTPERITLAEALERSEATQPSVIQAYGALRTPELAVRTAKMQYTPTLTFPLNAAYNVNSGGRQRLDPVAGQVLSGGTVVNPSYSVGAQANLTIFDG